MPVSPEGWRHDPFGGELITVADGVDEVWGRGAVDMLNLTSSMFVAFRDIVRTGTRYPGDILYFAVADEEMGGIVGAQPIVEDHWDMVKCDYVLTEYGGTPAVRRDGTTVLLTTRRKAICWPPHHRARHARPRIDAVCGRQRPREGRQDRRAFGVERHAPRIDDMFRERVAALDWNRISHDG